MFQIFINDEEVVCKSDFTIKEQFMNPSSINLYKVYPKSWKGTNKLLEEYYYPRDYSKCKILKDGELYFVGIVKNSADMELNPFKPHYCSVQILDPSTLLSEGPILDYVIANKTVEEAINQVISSISDYGFVVGNINIPEKENTVIGSYSTLDKAPYDVFKYLSIISGTRWGTRMVDEDTTAIDFYSPELLNSESTIKTSKEYCVQNKIIDINYDYSTTDYRNKQVITSSEVFADIQTEEVKIANGYSTQFNTEQKIGKTYSIKVNGISKTFATNEEKEMGIIADFYYRILENSFESDIVYPAGTEIEIKYRSVVNGREISYNTSEVSRIKGNLNRNGVIARYEDRKDITSSQELQAVSKSYIKFYGEAEISLKIVSENDFLILGGKYLFDSPVAELNGEYLVKSKNVIVHQSGDFSITRYEYELSNNFDTENEINYFDNQRAKANGNISGDYIFRNIDVENAANIIFDNLQVSEIEIKGDNIVNAVLDAPFTQ